MSDYKQIAYLENKDTDDTIENRMHSVFNIGKTNFDNLLCNFERENNLGGFLVTSFDVMHFTKAFSLFSKLAFSIASSLLSKLYFISFKYPLY